MSHLYVLVTWTNIMLITLERTNMYVVSVKSLFSQSSVLYAHKLRHSEINRYKFYQCEKSFSGSHGLKTHRKIHTEYMKYKCPLCNKCFTKAKELKTHNISKLCLLKTDNITYSVAVQKYVQLFGNCNHTKKITL